MLCHKIIVFDNSKPGLIEFIKFEIVAIFSPDGSNMLAFEAQSIMAINHDDKLHFEM